LKKKTVKNTIVNSLGFSCYVVYIYSANLGLKVACARREIDRTDHDKEQQRSTCVAPCTQEDDESLDTQFEGCTRRYPGCVS
jgi:hypothetical protein